MYKEVVPSCFGHCFLLLDMGGNCDSIFCEVVSYHKSRRDSPCTLTQVASWSWCRQGGLFSLPSPWVEGTFHIFRFSPQPLNNPWPIVPCLHKFYCPLIPKMTDIIMEIHQCHLSVFLQENKLEMRLVLNLALSIQNFIAQYQLVLNSEQ